MQVSLNKLTPNQLINQMPVGRFSTLRKIIPTGALQVRKQSNGTVTFYWRYSFGLKSERVTIGSYDSSAPPRSLSPSAKGFSIAAAEFHAQKLAQEHLNHKAQGGRPALLAEQAKVAHVQQIVAKEQETATVKHLLEAYCDYLEQNEKISHSEARSIFKVHVYEPWPSISEMPASEMTVDHVVEIMRRVIEQKKGRTANKVRTYLRAAYQTAKAVKTKPSVPKLFEKFKITVNPAAETSPDNSNNLPDKNPLELSELRLYWSVIKGMPGFKGAVLRLHLLTGAQRLAQLGRLLTANIKSDRFTLIDKKGRSGRPARIHPVYLIPEAKKALDQCKSLGKYALSTDGGITHIAGTTLSDWACDAATGIKDFSAKRIRSGVETLLASLKVSKETRGHLQSHGLSGVQHQSYDDYQYQDEIRDALCQLYLALDSTPNLGNRRRVKDVKSGVTP